MPILRNKSNHSQYKLIFLKNGTIPDAVTVMLNGLISSTNDGEVDVLGSYLPPACFSGALSESGAPFPSHLSTLLWFAHWQPECVMQQNNNFIFLNSASISCHRSSLMLNSCRFASLWNELQSFRKPSLVAQQCRVSCFLDLIRQSTFSKLFVVPRVVK